MNKLETLRDIARDSSVTAPDDKNQLELLRAICIRKGMDGAAAGRAGRAELVRYWAGRG